MQTSTWHLFASYILRGPTWGREAEGSKYKESLLIIIAKGDKYMAPKNTQSWTKANCMRNIELTQVLYHHTLAQ